MQITEVTLDDQEGPKSVTSLCESWSSTRPDSLPGICKHFTEHQDTDIFLVTDNTFSPIIHHDDNLGGFISSDRNIFLAAGLVSILVILVIIACLINNRKRKAWRIHRSECMGYRMQYLTRHHLQQQQVPITQYPVDVPPHYQAVMMIDDQDDEELPTYDEALAKTLG